MAHRSILFSWKRAARRAKVELRGKCRSMSRVFQMLARRGVGEFQVVLSMLSKNTIHRSLRAGRWLVTWAPLLDKKNLDNRQRSSTLRVTSGVNYFKILSTPGYGLVTKGTRSS